MRNILLCATPVVLLSFAPASAQQAISTPILTLDENFRDLAGISAIYGGTGFVDTTSNNGVMRTGVFYRSEALSQLTPADSATLSMLRIGLDIDLRTPTEIAGPAILPWRLMPDSIWCRMEPLGSTSISMALLLRRRRRE